MEWAPAENRLTAVATTRMKPSVITSSTKQTNAVAAAFACSILLVVPGCLPALRAPLPAQLAPQRYGLPQSFSGATAAENSAQVPAREFFTDPNLTSLIGFPCEGGRVSPKSNGFSGCSETQRLPSR